MDNDDEFIGDIPDPETTEEDLEENERDTW